MMVDMGDCEGRAWDYLFMAEAETDQTLKALLFGMWRNWLLLGQLERIDGRHAPRCHNGSLRRAAPGFIAARVFAILVRAEARGGPLRALICRHIREMLYRRLRRRARSKHASLVRQSA